MDSTKLNTIVTIIGIMVTIVGIIVSVAIDAIVGIIVVLIVLVVASILFISQNRKSLEKWRDDYIEEHSPSPNFKDEIKDKINESRSLYVQPYIEMEGKDKKKVVKLLREYFFNDVFVKKGAKEDKKVFCILGDTGMGKTAALVNLFVDYVKHYRKGNIPYDIWLYSLADQNVFEKINAVENKGKSILLLDAVDENNEAKDDNTYNDFIRKLELAYQDFAFVVTTCRPQFFGDESEVFNTTRAKRDGFFLKCKRLDLVQFDEGQVREYLFNLYYHKPNKEQLQKKAERIIEKCPKIAQRPLVLSYINELVSDENKNYETTLDVYDAIVTKLIEREINKTSPSADEKMIQQWRDLLSEVAGYMYKNGKLIISRKEYENFLSEHNLPEVVDEDRKQENVVDKKTFRQRSLLTRTAEGFEFSHKSFYEYFMAYRFFNNYGEIESVRNMDFAIQLFDELYVAYQSGKGGEHFGIDMVSDGKVAYSLYSLGKGLQKLNSFSKAEKEYGEALEKYRKLVDASPEAYLPYVAQTLNNLGILHRNTGQHGDAEKEYGEALEIRRKLAETSPEAYLPDVAGTLNNLGILHSYTGKHGDAEKEYGEALEKYRKLAESAPEAYLPDVAMTLNNLGNLHRNIGKHGDAEKELGEALEKYRKLAESDPEAYLPDVAMTLNNLGNLHQITGKHGDAEKEYVEALEKYRKLAEATPEAYLPYVATTLFNLAVFRMEQGQLSEAAQMAQESLEKYQTMAKLSPAAFNKDVEDAKNLLEKIRAKQAEEE